MNGKDALNKLMAGNKLYLEGNLDHPHQTATRRGDQASGQAQRLSLLIR